MSVNEVRAVQNVAGGIATLRAGTSANPDWDRDAYGVMDVEAVREGAIDQEPGEDDQRGTSNNWRNAAGVLADDHQPVPISARTRTSTGSALDVHSSHGSSGVSGNAKRPLQDAAGVPADDEDRIESRPRKRPRRPTGVSDRGNTQIGRAHV